MSRHLYALDQVSGTIVEDSADGDHGTLVGDPATFWQPTAVKRAGATVPSARRFPLTDYMHILFYGQSLSNGTSQTAQSTTAGYAQAVTFSPGGPKASKSGSVGLNAGTTTFKTLVEDNLEADNANASTRGETPCFFTANTLIDLINDENSIAPASGQNWICTTAGKGGSSIDTLISGALDTIPGDEASGDVEWWQVFEDHITEAKRICDGLGDTYSVPAVVWMQGEGNNLNLPLHADYLRDLVYAIRRRVVQLTGQSVAPVILFYQTHDESLQTTHDPYASQAQHELAAEFDDVYIVNSVDRLEKDGDTVHLHWRGSQQFGAMVARAVKDRVIDHREVRWVRPLSARASGTKLTVQYDAPFSELAFDNYSDNMFPTTDQGFVVADADGALTLSNIAVDRLAVTMDLNRAITADARVRYGFNYRGTGEPNPDAASGTLRENNPATVTIDSAEQPMWKTAVHFAMDVDGAPAQTITIGNNGTNYGANPGAGSPYGALTNSGITLLITSNAANPDTLIVGYGGAKYRNLDDVQVTIGDLTAVVSWDNGDSRYEASNVSGIRPALIALDGQSVSLSMAPAPAHIVVGNNAGNNYGYNDGAYGSSVNTHITGMFTAGSGAPDFVAMDFPNGARYGFADQIVLTIFGRDITLDWSAGNNRYQTSSETGIRADFVGADGQAVLFSFAPA